MRELVLVLVFSVSMGAQSPEQVLRKTAQFYQDLDSYEIKGHLTTTIPESTWSFQIETISVAAGKKFVPPGNPWPALPPMTQFRNGHTLNTHPDNGTQFSGNISMPSIGNYETLRVGVQSVKRTAAETLILGGKRVDCVVLEVVYVRLRGDHKHPERYLETIKYWISPAKHLVLREKLAQTEPKSGQVYEWTYTVDSVSLNNPPPQWLVEASEKYVGQERKDWIQRSAPDFTLTDLTGHKLILSELRNKVVMLDFWATYCGPCKEQMPFIAKLRDQYRTQGLEVWEITDESPEIARAWLHKQHLSLSTLIDEGRSSFRNYEVEGIPVLVLIGRDGKVVRYMIGMQKHEDLTAAVEKALQR